MASSSTSTAIPAEPEFLKHACDATRILAKRRQLIDLKERYAKEKEMLSLLDEREADLTRREAEFEDKLMKFEKNAKENESKETTVKICEDLKDEQSATLEAMVKPQQLDLYENRAEVQQVMDEMRLSLELKGACLDEKCSGG